MNLLLPFVSFGTALAATGTTADVVALCQRLAGPDEYILVGVADPEAHARLEAEVARNALAPVYVIRLREGEDAGAQLTGQLEALGMTCGLHAEPGWTDGWRVTSYGSCASHLPPDPAPGEPAPSTSGGSAARGQTGSGLHGQMDRHGSAAGGRSAVTASSASQRFEPVAFHTLKFDISPGAEIGLITSPRTMSPTTITWGDDYSAQAWNIDQDATDVMRKAGLAVVGGGTDLFGAAEPEHARYVVGGLVKSLTYKSYEVPFHISSHCIVSVEWQIFDTRRNRVVHSATSGGKKEHDKIAGLEGACRGAVRASLGSFASRPDTREVLRAAPEPTAVRWDSPVTIPACPEPKAHRLPADLEQVLGAVLMVSTDNGGGAGVLISPEGHALTAAHVLDGAERVEAQLHAGMSLPARVLRVDPHHDVALIQLEGSGYPCTPSVTEPPGLGAALFAIGSPAGSALSFSVSRGIVSGHREWEDWRFIQTDASLNPGNSGGPLLDENGRLVGIVSFKLSGPTLEGLGFGVPVDAALEGLALTQD